MSTAIEIKGISPDKTLETCARLIIVGYFQEMMSHKAGAIEGIDIEFVHNMRVASRRLREAMDNFVTCFEEEPFKKHYKQVRTITRTMGAVRDLDVLIARFDSYNRELNVLSAARENTEGHKDIRGLIQHLQYERENARKPMLKLFAELDNSDFETRFLTFFKASD
ncbi:CHAD domain-containing protein [Candidatus Poribacteria bacterium]|nr:CHAD domain-containing protein [Candidatus Poribacteria bacterium]MYB63072.1 CHAD domain-containing protein [Candidatus Poribacteria bacterium]MYF56365.1 CHAD domain-containing protein [Candidatus Poribacteria bacterium]MYI94068.1 CHAD domain-containing protein [Candidatus Poribacteria bacterium]